MNLVLCLWLPYEPAKKGVLLYLLNYPKCIMSYYCARSNGRYLRTIMGVELARMAH